MLGVFLNELTLDRFGLNEQGRDSVDNWMLIICVMVITGLLGIIVPYCLQKSSRQFKQKSTPVRVRVLEIVKTSSKFDDNSTWKPKFEIISGEFKGKSGTPRFGTNRSSEKAGEEIDAFYDVESQHIESVGTLDIYSKIALQSYIISPMILMLAGYFYYTKFLTA